MAQVFVGQVENLEEAILGLKVIYDSMKSACRAQMDAAEIKLSEVQLEFDNSARLLEVARTLELEAAQSLELAQIRLAAAYAALAVDPLAACEVVEAEIAAAAAEEAYAMSKCHRMRMELRGELAHKCLSMAQNLTETVRAECDSRLTSTESHLEIGKIRLESARVALYTYLDTHSSNAEFYSWLKWSPTPNRPITPKELHSRLNLTKEQLRCYFEYLFDRDHTFRAKIKDFKEQLHLANGSVERHMVLLKMRKNLSGHCAEKIVEHALAPLGCKVSKQSRTTFEDGRSTKTDLVIEDLKVPVILGRGEGMSAASGGSIAIEVKCGSGSYLYSEKDHMVFQSKGHQKADTSMTICSRDIKDLTPEKEEELRDALREAGSPLIGMLPRKDEIDQACWKVITGSNAKGEIHEN
ncbi:MAG: hypothetical protein HQK52_12745 [Oligoflexia bacterium]|nr:hypothetical protein [Oligoflexia bacterium]